ncbi:MAG: aldo/keto reductase, partial [Gammaproteobacteria bacterium]
RARHLPADPAMNERPLAIGCMRLSTEPDRNDERSIAVLHAAFDAGVTLLDTADAYCWDDSETGHNERLIATALATWPSDRSPIRIATKGGITRPKGRWEPDGRAKHLIAACERSCRALNVDAIDLYQLHTVDRKVPLEQSLGALKEMQDAGKIRHVGLSNVSTQEIERARKILPIVSVQNEYNIQDRTSEGVLGYCEKESLGFIPWFPIGGGRGLKSENAVEIAARDHGVSVVQVALAWLLQRSPVMLPIPGTSSIAHLEENVADAKIKLTLAEWKAIDAIAGQG